MPRYNKDPNPYAASTATGYSGSGTSGYSAARQASITGMDRASGYQVINGSTAGQMFCYIALQQVAASAGQTWSATGQARLSVAGTLQFFVVWINSSGAQIGTSPGVSLAVPAATAVRITDVGTVAPSGTAYACGAFVTSSLSASATLLVTAHRIEQINDPNLGYGDGTSDRWAWDGTAGASTSTRTSDDGVEWWTMLSA